MLNIESAHYYIPDHFVDISNVNEIYGIPKNELKVFTRLYGLKKIPMALNMRLLDLLRKPITALLHERKINPHDIKLIIHAHTAKVVSPFSRSVVQAIKNEFNFDHAVAFGVTMNNCASMLTSLQVVTHLLQTMEPKAQALIISGEIIFTEVQRVIPKISILGDAAAMMLVGNSGFHHQLLALEMSVDGASAAGVWMTEEQKKQYERDYAPAFAAVIKAALAKAGLNLSEVTLILPHNINLPSWSNVAKCLDISIDKIYLENVKHYSHCFGADNVINLVDAIREGLIKPGDYYVIASVGLGSIYAAAVFRY